MNDFLRALGLLTVLPVRVPVDDGAPPGQAMAFYPLIGALIGAGLAGLAWLLRLLGLAENAPLLPAALLLATWAGLTGALHLDGWADCCDALFVPVSRERRLEIMKDPRLGGFGAAGLILLLLIKLAALQGVTASPHALPALIAIPALGRWASVIAAKAYPSARPGGMGDFFRRGLGRRELVIATVCASLAAVGLLWRGAILWAVVALALLALASLARARLGGLTGDVYGATIELAETAALVVACFLA
ncbi:MAG: adenosylcobinamide-GDP ribazoletransferase [Chloroflexi bacterium HGW-Chloroflexi-1]|nr:MAG: adenosylcobinamide-GDP ribazoletransferase [Chloroflexi bacterium HGW-Chloroflexi-1]